MKADIEGINDHFMIKITSSKRSGQLHQNQAGLKLQENKYNCEYGLVKTKCILAENECGAAFSIIIHSNECHRCTENSRIKIYLN